VCKGDIGRRTNDVWVNSRSNLRVVTQTDRKGERGGKKGERVMELYRQRAVKHIDRLVDVGHSRKAADASERGVSEPHPNPQQFDGPPAPRVVRYDMNVR